ncbi:hypothetical protein Z517_00003 [Fonsecaea pedrosoi CBS 271.37]|uniref:Uncharacterized protein n=1 Tax=Fonsecaea pedrosoi CBS 271.37 TaxID=1442368 RepID=A0A0D2H172_9EURO|nr:uncharacterized protein Z517_00003 [Fonsecaea pedrosoi CBS 271.37]KIW84615.1 hypothetical protein Z517_00003 [Fonsecaea pedrosoi CBS 271.37]
MGKTIKIEWLKELRTRFTGIVRFYIFYGTDKATISSETRAALLPSDPVEARESRTLVTLPGDKASLVEDKDLKIRLATAKPPTADAHLREDDLVVRRTNTSVIRAVDNDDEGFKEERTDKSTTYGSVLKYCFRVVILDEGYKVKNYSSRNYIAVQLLYAPIV